MTNIEWLNMRKEVCEHGIEIYYDKIKEFERELEAIKSLIGLTEGESIEPKRNIKIVENPEYVVAYEHNEIIKEGFDTKAAAEEWVKASINSGENWSLLREAKALHEVFKEGDSAYVIVDRSKEGREYVLCEMQVAEIAPYGKIYDCYQYIKLWNLHLVSCSYNFYKQFSEIGKTVFVSKEAAMQRIAANSIK